MGGGSKTFLGISRSKLSQICYSIIIIIQIFVFFFRITIFRITNFRIRNIGITNIRITKFRITNIFLENKKTRNHSIPVYSFFEKLGSE